MSLLIAFLLVMFAVPPLLERNRQPMDSIARQSAQGGFASLSQGVTHYEWMGPVRGPIAVCVHGLTTPSFVWRGLARGMALMGYRVLVYDLYGRGYSDRPSGPQDKAFFLQQLSDLMGDQQVEGDITLLGYSMGGAIATAYAAANPDRIRHLVLLAPAGMGARVGAMTRFIAKTPVIGDWMMLAMFPTLHRKSSNQERSLPSSVENIVDLQQEELRYRGFVPAVLASIRGILAENLRDDHETLYRANIPVLAIWGRKDDVIPLRATGQLTEWNRNTRQEVIEGAGHGLPYTHTDAVLGAMRDALRDGLN